MQFEKAAAKQAKVKMALYGPAGSGKTFTAMLMAEGLAARDGKRVAFVDTERGTDFLTKQRPGGPHPAPFDFDAIYTRSIKDVLTAVRALDTEKYGVLVIDSVSHLWQAMIDAQESRTSIGTIKMQDWGKIKRPNKELTDLVMGLPIHVFLCGRQKNVFEEDEKGDLKKTGVAMKAETEMPYEPHICARMEAKVDQKNPAQAVYTLFAEKDRTGVLSGRTFANPSFATIEPILALLGDEQAPQEDEDDRMAKDAELLTGAEDKAAKKAEKSGRLLTEFQAKVAGAQTPAELGAVALELGKQKRYLLDEHLSTLRVLYEQRREDVTRAAVPEGV